MNIINEFEHEIDKIRVIEQMTKSNTAIREAVDEVVPLLTELDTKLPEPYKTDLATVLDVVKVLQGLAHATRTFATTDEPAPNTSVNLSAPVDVEQLAADAAAAEINAQAHDVAADLQ